ncbi:MAG TPA: STAS domain-containing protein [Fibrobacteria bacterium]|nr:STAS domain-containing protein [Fibrobacteria bacterium]HOX53742.1 STAS domain-containing protein [Fibrobacteria bacterium]
MQISVTKTKGHVKTRLSGELEISNVAEARDHLLQVVEAGTEATIDFSNLTEIDTSGIQLVLALRKHMSMNDRKCRIVHPSPSVAEAFELLGLLDVFDESILGSQAKG